MGGKKLRELPFTVEVEREAQAGQTYEPWRFLICLFAYENTLMRKFLKVHVSRSTSKKPWKSPFHPNR